MNHNVTREIEMTRGEKKREKGRVTTHRISITMKEVIAPPITRCAPLRFVAKCRSSDNGDEWMKRNGMNDHNPTISHHINGHIH